MYELFIEKLEFLDNRMINECIKDRQLVARPMIPGSNTTWNHKRMNSQYGLCRKNDDRKKYTWPSANPAEWKKRAAPDRPMLHPGANDAHSGAE